MDAEEFIRRHGRAVAEVTLGGGDFPSSMHTHVLKNNDERLVLAFDTGAQKFVLKQVKTDSIKGGQSYLRERDGLGLFSKSGLFPEITHFNDKDLFVISRFVEGSSVLECIDDDNCVTLCEAVGYWFADYYRAAPGVAAPGTWRGHLHKLSHGPYADAPALDTFLASMPIKRTAWSRGDGALTNLIVKEDGYICGIDFEKSRWHPHGWDVLLTARAVARRVPQQTQACISALVEGFCEGHREQMRRWQALTTIFVASYLFAESQDESDGVENMFAAPKPGLMDRDGASLNAAA